MVATEAGTGSTMAQWKNPACHAATPSTVMPTNVSMISGPPTSPASGSSSAALLTATACSAGRLWRIARS